MQKVDRLTDELLARVQSQQSEIKQLKDENRQLKISAEKTLNQVQDYVAELEEIKKSLCQ